MPASDHENRLPRFVLDQLSACPTAGEGVNRWFFCTARLMHHFRKPWEIITLLEINSFNCGRRIRPGEIERAVKNSEACAWHPGQHTEWKQSAWPEFDPMLRAKVIDPSLTLANLRNAYPCEAGRGIPETLHRLFGIDGSTLLCCGYSKTNFRTRTMGEWLWEGLHKLQFIVPSPMSKPIGITKEGKPSSHCLDNTGPRRFLVIEQDRGSIDEQAAFLLHLKTRAPLAMAVYSGKKSIHGWFYCNGHDEDHLENFMRYCVRRGADPATWVRSQFVRIPDGMRDGALQEVYYLDPGVIK